MKAHTNDFKNNIKQFGKEIDSIITYTIDGVTTELGKEELNSVTPHYEGSILKSVMRQLDIDSNVDIPKETIINYRFGVKVNDEFEYIDFGNYVVYSSEKQEDLNSYKIVCYDKMLYSMKDYENMHITYPITIRNYLNAICNHLGLTFGSSNVNFANYNKEIQTELFLDASGNSLNYTFRDVLDQLAQVTASTICINETTDQLEVRYITNTNDTIDEEFFKNINVNFGEKFGPVNSIVLSRSAESDNVYLQDEQSITDNGLCEIKIKDNQIMNFNDRSDYLPGILGQLNGLEYYFNDYASFGICYYNLCDRYNVTIGENTYNCVMFNDEVNVTQGLEEHVYTKRPEESETDYTKADKTDRRINQTYLIVDKQNQVIQSVVSNVTQQNNKISQITQTVDELNSKISDIADITISGESSFANFTLDNINQSEPIMIRVRPTVKNISYLYPHDGLFPSDDLYMPTRTIRFANLKEFEVSTDMQYVDYKKYYSESGGEYTLLVKGTDYNVGDTIVGTVYENKYYDYELPDDLLIYDQNHYDEFYLDYDSQTCQVTKRCKYNADGTVALLDDEIVTDYPYNSIILTDGDYNISLLNYEYGYLFTRLMTKNIYTSQFATKVEVNTAITQTAQDITLQVDQKTSTNELISKINLSPGNILLEGTVTANENFKILNDGSIVAKNGSFSGNIYLENGGKVLGGDGLMSVLRFNNDGFEGANGWGNVGFTLKTDESEYEYIGWQYLTTSVPYFIPENFTITEAYLVLESTPMSALVQSGEKVTGTCKQLKVYNVDNLNGVLYYYWNSYGKWVENDSVSGTEIVNAFGSATYTPSVTTLGSTEQKISNNIASYLSKGRQSSLNIRTNMAKPPFRVVDEELNIDDIRAVARNTGAVKANLYVYGYMKYEN